MGAMTFSRPGAVDLSALAQPAGRPAGAPAGSGGAYVVDNFALVLKAMFLLSGYVVPSRLYGILSAGRPVMRWIRSPTV